MRSEPGTSLIEIDGPDGSVLRVWYWPWLPAPGLYCAIILRREGERPPDYSRARLKHPDAITGADLMRAIESGALPFDSDPARRVIALQPPPGSDGKPDIPDYAQRLAEAIRAYAEWLAKRIDGARVDAPDPREWSDEATRIPPGAVA